MHKNNFNLMQGIFCQNVDDAGAWRCLVRMMGWCRSYHTSRRCQHCHTPRPAYILNPKVGSGSETEKVVSTTVPLCPAMLSAVRFTSWWIGGHHATSDKLDSLLNPRLTICSTCPNHSQYWQVIIECIVLYIHSSITYQYWE